MLRKGPVQVQKEKTDTHTQVQVCVYFWRARPFFSFAKSSHFYKIVCVCVPSVLEVVRGENVKSA